MKWTINMLLFTILLISISFVFAQQADVTANDTKQWFEAMSTMLATAAMFTGLGAFLNK